MADEATFEIEGWGELLQCIEEVEQGSGRFSQMITNTMQMALDALEQAIKDRTPVNTGLLRGSIANMIYGRPPTIEGAVATPISYGAPVEYGRAAGKMPPVDAIRKWVHDKGLAAVYSWKSGKKLKRKEDIEAEKKRERRMAWGIALKIAREGTEGAHMFRDGLDAAQPKIFDLFEQLRDDILTEMVNA